MENQEKQLVLDRIMNFIIELLVKCTSSRSEFNTYRTKAIFKTLLLVIGVLLCLLFAGIVLGIYLFSIFLMVFAKILSFGASADKTHGKSQDRHYEEHGRYY
jgi:uncharacterized membrane protein